MLSVNLKKVFFMIIFGSAPVNKNANDAFYNKDLRSRITELF